MYLSELIFLDNLVRRKKMHLDVSLGRFVQFLWSKQNYPVKYRFYFSVPLCDPVKSCRNYRYIKCARCIDSLWTWIPSPKIIASHPIDTPGEETCRTTPQPCEGYSLSALIKPINFHFFHLQTQFFTSNPSWHQKRILNENSIISKKSKIRHHRKEGRVYIRTIKNYKYISTVEAEVTVSKLYKT